MLILSPVLLAASHLLTFPPSSPPSPPPNLNPPSCSIAAESARVVAAAESQVLLPCAFGHAVQLCDDVQARALELEAAEAKRDAGEKGHWGNVSLGDGAWALCAGKMQATLRQTERQLLRLQV